MLFIPTFISDRLSRIIFPLEFSEGLLVIFQIRFAWKYLCIALILDKKKILNIEDRLVVIFVFSSFLSVYLFIYLF